MKNFFNIKSIKENIIFYALFVICAILVPFTPFKFLFVDLFNIAALIIALLSWVFCSFIDKEKYFNFGVFLTIMLIEYPVLLIICNNF